MFHQSFIGLWFLAVLGCFCDDFPFPPPTVLSVFSKVVQNTHLIAWQMMKKKMIEMKKIEDLRTKRAASQPSRSRDEPGVPGNTWNVRPGNPISTGISITFWMI